MDARMCELCFHWDTTRDHQPFSRQEVCDKEFEVNERVGGPIIITRQLHIRGAQQDKSK